MVILISFNVLQNPSFAPYLPKDATARQKKTILERMGAWEPEASDFSFNSDLQVPKHPAV